MSAGRDIERLLDAWLADGPMQVPDRAFDEAVGRVYRQRQRPAWRLLPWRFPTVSTPFKLAAIGAALLAVVLGGAVFLGGGAGPGPGPSPSPTPTPNPTLTPTPTPTPSAVFPQWFTAQSDGAGILPAGDWTTHSFLPGSAFRVPAGWVNDVDTTDTYGLFPDTAANEAEFARSGGLAQVIFMGKVDSPWVICEGVGETEGATAAELVDSLVANEALSTSEPVEVTIGGLTGWRVDAQLNPDWTGSCPLGPEDSPTKDDKDYRGRFFFLDAPGGGKILIIVDSITSADFEAFLAEAVPIVESFEFDPAP